MPLEKARVYQNVVMKLSVLRFMVKTMSAQGKTDLNRGCESFFATVLNYVYDYNLKNVNEKSMNEAAIDLADQTRELCIQVTATSDAKKIKKTIETFNRHKLYEKYKELQFLMLVDKKNYTTTFDTDSHFNFDHKRHVLDIDDVLVKAESLDLGKLEELSSFIDQELPSISRALAPKSLLANAEHSNGKPPATAARYREIMGYDDDPEWKEDFDTLVRLQRRLALLSREQREVIFYMIKHGVKSQCGQRIAMSIQTLQQRLNIEKKEMRDYYIALEDAGFMFIDEEDRSRKVELGCTFKGSGNDVFMMLKEFLKEDGERKRVIIDCDFSVLDN